MKLANKKTGEEKTELKCNSCIGNNRGAVGLVAREEEHFESYGSALRTPEGLSGSSRKIYH